MLPKSMLVSELIKTHPDPPQYVVDGFLAVGGLSLLVAAPKAGKSTLARNLQVQVARGGKFFGRSTYRVPIVYLALEEPIEHVASEFITLGVNNEEIHVRVGAIPHAQVIEVLESDIREYHAGLAIVDPLFDALGDVDVNSYGEMNRALKEILAIARATKCHVMILHHANKRDGWGGSTVLGSQATSGATDHNAFLTMRRDGTRYFESQARVGTPFELCTLAFDDDTHSLYIASSVKDVRRAAIAHELLAVLEAEGELNVSDWRAKVRGRNTDKAEAICALEEQGLIIKRLAGRNTFWGVMDEHNRSTASQ